MAAQVVGTAQSKHQTLLCAHGLQHLFEAQQRHLNHFFDKLDLRQALAFAQALLDAPGGVFFSGVGKSGLIARKLSQTLASLGFSRAAFLPPVDALHGDIGSLCAADVLVLLSKSGSSDELLRLVPCARAKGAFLVSMTSVEGNRLAALCDGDGATFAAAGDVISELCLFIDRSKPGHERSCSSSVASSPARRRHRLPPPSRCLPKNPRKAPVSAWGSREKNKVSRRREKKKKGRRREEGKKNKRRKRKEKKKKGRK